MKLKQTFFRAGAASLLPFALALAPVAAAHADEPAQARPFVITVKADAAPLSHPEFRYPSYAGVRGLEGACEVSFVVDTAGRTDGIRVAACTSDVFRAAAKKAVAGMMFATRQAPTENVRATIRWSIDDNAPRLSTASLN